QQRAATPEIDRRVATVLARLQLDTVVTSKPGDLSLEQRRRLALARALAVEPRVLLLDEPLANVDPTARKVLRLELAKLHRDLAVTTLHATRNAADALALSDRLAVMDGGRVRRGFRATSPCASSRAAATCTRSRLAPARRCVWSCRRWARAGSSASVTASASKSPATPWC